MQASETLPIRITLFGAPQVTSADGTKVFPLPRKTLDVLAFLLLNRGRSLPRASVAFALFPDCEEEAARNSLRRNLSYLLSSLPAVAQSAPFVIADGKTLAWNSRAPATVDVDEFERAIADGRDDDALRIYSGDLLPTIYADWATVQRERVRAQYHDLLLRKIAEQRSRRRFDEASTVARTLLSEDPWREDVVRLLMAIRHEAGDRSGALAEYERLATRLRSEMQAEPMSETIALRDAVVRGDRLPTSEHSAETAAAQTKPALGLPFVGRHAPMEVALARWHLAADGRGGALFVAGAAGIGKSRFVTELARAVEHEGGVVLRGQTSAGGERQPYEAFVDALKRAPHRDRVERIWDAHAHATLTDDRAARVRFFESVRAEIAEFGRTRPLTLVLEDLHWAGRDTTALLEYVVSRLGQRPILIVVTMRTDELARAHPLRALSRHLQSSGSADIVTLSRLDRDDAVRAITATIERDLDDIAVAEAAAWADGVPLLLLEAVREIGAGRSPAGGGMASLLGDRFARLTPAASTALIYSATIGNRFELATVAAVTGWSDAEVIDALGESVELGLVRAAESSGSIAFSFTHHVLHAAAYERVEAPERARAHAIVARVLETGPESASSGAAEVARHFERAAEAARAARYWAHAARYALSIFANEEARAAATAGLALAGDDVEVRYELLAAREDALRRIGAATDRRADSLALLRAAGDDPDRRSDALERVFEAHRDDVEMRQIALQELGALAPAHQRHAAIFERASSRDAFLDDRFEKARDSALRSAQLFERLGDERSEIRARLTYVTMLRVLDESQAADRVIAELRPRVEASDDVALAAEFYRVAAHAGGDDRRAATLADARRSLELALRVGDRHAEARARETIAMQVRKLRKYAKASDEFEQSLSAYRDVGNAAGANNVILNLASERVWHGDFASARRLLGELPPDVSRRHVLYAQLISGYAELHERAFTESEAKFSNAKKGAIELGLPLLEVRAGEFLAESYWLRGDAARARVTLNESLDQLSKLHEQSIYAELRAFSARLHAESGELDAAMEDSRIAADLAESYPIEEYGRFTWNLAVAHALACDHGAAEELAEQCARAFVEDAMEMDAERAESYSCLPWYREAIAFLSGRGLPKPPVQKSARNASGTLRS